MSDGTPPPYPPPGPPVESFPAPGSQPAEEPSAPAGLPSYASSQSVQTPPLAHVGLPAGSPAAAAWLPMAAHRPGAIPLRPLSLGQMYDGAFRIIRHNPKATVGSAVLVTAVAMSVPIVVSLVTAFTLGTGLDASGDLATDASMSEAIGALSSLGSLVLGIYAAQLGLVYVTGMIAQVTLAAAVGRKMSLGEAWASTQGKRWQLLGLTLLTGLGWLVVFALTVAVVVVAALVGGAVAAILVGLTLGIAFLVVSAWLWIKVVYLASVTLMLEDVGVFGALRRCWRLTTGHYWRTFGIALLTVLIASIAGGILSAPVTIAAEVGAFVTPEYTLILLVAAHAIGSVVQNAFVAPFSASVASLQYVDLRIRKEAYDVELMREAGILPE